MSTTALPSAESGDLVRVSVAAGDRVSDLVLPARLPLAELVPEVASVVGALDPYDVHGGYALVQADGRSLDPDASLLAQGVHDGALLSLVAGADLASPKVYDDLVEAVADAVEDTGTGWGESAARASLLAVAALLLALGGFVLYLQRTQGVLVTVVAFSVTVLLLLAGAVFARVRGDRPAAVLVLVAAAAYGVVGAVSAVDGQPFAGPLLAAGVALVLVGVVATLVLPTPGWTFMPCFVLGSLAVAIGTIRLLAPAVPADRVLAVVMVVAVVLGSVIPWFALSTSRTLPDPMTSPDEILADPDEIDPEQVRRGVELAHEVVLGLSVSIAILVVVVAPTVAGLGWAGLGLIWAAGLAQVMRTRQVLLAQDVLVGLLGGVAGIVSGTVAAVLARPEWGGVVGLVVAAVAVGVLATLAVPRSSSVRGGRLLDLVEGLALFALVPLLVVAVGLVGR